MADKKTLRLVSSDGNEDLVEIEQHLWDRFVARAAEMGMTEEDALVAALDSFLRAESGHGK